MQKSGIPTFKAAAARLDRPALLCLLLALAAAAGLRLWGIDWGTPDRLHFYPFHPDEAVTLGVISRVNLLWGELLPGYYNYPSGYFFLTRLGFDLLAPAFGWRTIPGDAHHYLDWVDGVGRFLVVARGVNICFSLLTIWLIWLIGRRHYSPRTGNLAAAAFAAAPMPVVLCHYATVDTVALGWTVAALFFSMQLLLENEAKRLTQMALAAGAAAGAAAGTKYNAGLVLLLVPAALFFCRRQAPLSWKHALGLTAGAGAAAALLFLLFTPGALLQSGAFRRDLGYEAAISRSGMGLLSAGMPPPLIYHLSVSLPVALEWPLYLFCCAGAGAALLRRRPADTLLLILAALILLTLALSARIYVRYALPLVPVFILFGAALAEAAGSESRRRHLRAGFGLALTAAAVSSVAHAGTFAAPDSRLQAAALVRTLASPGDIVALGTDPWYYTPPVDPSAGSVKMAGPFGGPPVWERRVTEADPLRPFPVGAMQVLAPRRNMGALPLNILEQYRPRFLLISDFEYEDSARLQRRSSSYSDPTTVLLERLSQEYRVAGAFRPRPAFGPLVWWPRGTPPHDWRYQMPTILLYERKSGSPGAPEAEHE